MSGKRFSNLDRKFIHEKIMALKEQRPADFNVEDFIPDLIQAYKANHPEDRHEVCTAEKIREVANGNVGTLVLPKKRGSDGMEGEDGSTPAKTKRRKSEGPKADHVFDLQGPQDVDSLVGHARDVYQTGTSLMSSSTMDYNAQIQLGDVSHAASRLAQQLSGFTTDSAGNDVQSIVAMLQKMITDIVNFHPALPAPQTDATTPQPQHQLLIGDSTTRRLSHSSIVRPGSNDVSNLAGGINGAAKSFFKQAQGLLKRLARLARTKDEVMRRKGVLAEPTVPPPMPITAEDKAAKDANLEALDHDVLYHTTLLCEAIERRRRAKSYLIDPQLMAATTFISRDDLSRDTLLLHNLHANEVAGPLCAVLNSFCSERVIKSTKRNSAPRKLLSLVRTTEGVHTRQSEIMALADGQQMDEDSDDGGMEFDPAYRQQQLQHSMGV